MKLNSKTKTIMLVPCFNEGNRINVDYWNEILTQSSFEWLFINDGSTDETLNKLQSIKDCKVLNLPRNLGKAEALRKGVQFVFAENNLNYSSLGYLDADDAFSINDIVAIYEKFISLHNSFDALWVSRVALAGRDIMRNEKRHIISRIIVTIFGSMYQDLPYDPQAGFKIFRINDQFIKIFDDVFKTRWFIDLEILLRFQKLNNRKMKIWEEVASYWRDVPVSKIKGKEILRIFKEFLTIRNQMKRMREI